MSVHDGVHVRRDGPCVSRLTSHRSNFAVNFILMLLPHKDARGKWQGRNAAASAVAQAAAPLLMAIVYDARSGAPDYDTKGMACLAVTISISFLSFLTYVPLIKLVPKEIEAKIDPSSLKEEELETYLAMSNVEFALLPLKTKYVLPPAESPRHTRLPLSRHRRAPL